MTFPQSVLGKIVGPIWHIVFAHTQMMYRYGLTVGGREQMQHKVGACNCDAKEQQDRPTIQINLFIHEL